MKKDNPLIKIQGNNTNELLLNSILLILSILPIWLLFSLVKEYSLNLPFQDDWDAILKYLNSWGNSAEKIKLLFSQHNEHRILSSRLTYIIYYNIFNKIDLQNIIIIGNIQLILITAILSFFCFKSLGKYWSIAVIIINLCVFDPSNYENSNFAMGGMQNYGVILFFLSSLFFYYKSFENNYYLVFAVIFHFLCTFSSGNGIIGGFVLVLFALIGGKKKSKIISISSFILFTSLYFYSYQSTPKANVEIKFNNIITFFLKLSGGHFGYDDRIMFSLIIFGILLIAFFYKKKILLDKKILPFTATLAFIICSMATVALFRTGGKEDIDHDSFGSRYLIYAHMLAALCFIIVCYKLKEVNFKWAILTVFSIFFIKAYKSNYEYGENGFARTNYRLLNTNYYYPDSNYAKKIAIESCQKGIYCIEENRNP